jgi:type II secretion system protein G
MRGHRGFTLIELLIVVAIIGIIVLIAIPNLMNALNRGRQKRAMADIRALITAASAYRVDFEFFPRSLAANSPTTAIATFIAPTFIKTIARTDGWGQPLGCESSADGNAITLWCQGKGSATTVQPYLYRGSNGSAFVTTNYAEDIISYDHEFLQYPEGLQVN